MKKHLLQLMTLFSVCYVFNAIAEDTKIYRWIDDKGMMHFSSKPTEQYEFVELRVSDLKVNQVSAQDPIQAPEKETSLAQTMQERAIQYCEKARLNLELIKNNPTIQQHLENGEIVTLNKEQIEAQRALAEKQITIFCQ